MGITQLVHYPPSLHRPDAIRRALVLFLWITVLPALLFLLAAWLTPASLEDNGRVFTAWSYAAFMARTFTFHAGIGLLLAAVLAAFCRAKRASIAAGAIGALTVFPALIHLPVIAPPEPTRHDTLTLLAHNLLFINNDTARVLHQIAEADPDIVLFQEYTPAHHAAIAPALAAHYPHEVHAYRDGSYGQAIYSKRPFVGEPAISREVMGVDKTPFNAGNGPQIAVQTLVDNQPVTIRCVHTDAPGSLALYRAQRRQFAHLQRTALDERGPVIFAGDFNATGSSQHMAGLRAVGLTDAMDAVAIGRACTWPDRTLLRLAPGIRIDHIMYSRGLECEGARVGGSTGSDHLPVFARFRIDSSPRFEEW